MPPIPPPTARLAFRRWTAGDLELARSLWCDAEVMRFIGGPYSEEELVARIEREVTNEATLGVQYWPLFTLPARAGFLNRRDDFSNARGDFSDARSDYLDGHDFSAGGGEFVGCCGLKPHAADARMFEIGFQLRPPFWRAGYATEAARAVIEHARNALNATRLFAGRHPENTGSDALLVKLGFERIGTHFFARTGLDHPWYELSLE